MRLLSIVPAALLAVAFTAGAASVASAQYQPQPGYQQQPPVYQQQQQAPGYRPHTYQMHDIRWIKSRVGTAVITLNKERRAYGGHRANALGLLRDANQELKFAIGFALDHGYQFQDLGVEHAPAQGGYARESPDRAVFEAQRHAQNWIDMLQRDNRDYGGHRVAALNLLQHAESELTAALQTGQ